MTLHNRPALLLWILLLFISGGIVANMTMTTDLTALLPRSADHRQELLVSQLRDGVAARLILIGLSGADAEALAQASRTITRKLRDTALFASVNNGDPADLTVIREVLMRHRYLLSPAVSPEHFTATALREALKRQLELLASPAGALMKTAIPSDPTGEVAHILSVFTPDEGPSMHHGVWFSRDGTRAQLVAETNAPGFALDQQEAAVKAVRTAFSSSGLPETAHLIMTGPGVFAVESRATIQRDSWRLSLIAISVVTVLLFAVYRSATPLVLSLLPVLTGLLAGVAAVQMVFGFVHGITLGFGATLIGEAVDYPAYVFTQGIAGERLQHSLSRVWPTLRLAVLTTVFGAVSMLFSSITGLSQLGVLASVGILVAGFVTRWILPALPPGVIRSTPHQLLPVQWLPAPAVLNRVRWIVWVAAFLALATMTLRQEDIWDNDLANLSPISSPSKTLDEQLRKDLGAPDVRYVLIIDGTSKEEVLQRSESAEQLLRRLVDDGLLAGFDMPSLYLPSDDTQHRRQASLPPPEVLAASLAEAVKGLPFQAGLFEPFLHDVEAARTSPLMDSVNLQQTAFFLKVRSLLVRNGDGWAGFVPLRNVISASALADRLARDAGPGLTFLDLKSEAGRLVNGYRHESLRLTALGVVAMTLLLWWGLRDAAMVGRVLVPPLLAILFVVTLLTVIGEHLSLFHLVSLLLVLGVGLNYALFFNRPFSDEEEKHRTWLSLTVCMLATLSAFGALAFSRTPVLHAIGLTVGLGAAASLVIAAIFGQQRVSR
ncbi:MAG: MMPL family transporter [Nitrospira sp. CR1.1]|nr:MMPL family transporter [Nitrospira sp. CR1.1]